MSQEIKTIGVLIPYVDQYYQCDLWRSMIHEAEKLNYQLLFFCGSILDSPLHREKENNVIYQLPNLQQVDGIISVAGTLANAAGIEVYNEFIEQYNHIPIIEVSLDLEGRNCIVVDNYSSMRKVIEHVIKEHTYKHYGFISGPKVNEEAKQREQAFIDMMNEAQVSSENITMIEGDFSQESAIEAVELFLKTGQKIPEIFICANDEMAIGVLTILREHGIKVPMEVAFTGFDDISNSTTFSPAFTTVRQPLRSLGRQAVKGIDSLLSNSLSQIHESLAGELIVRESCGCFGLIDREIGSEYGVVQEMTTDDLKEVINALNLIKNHHLDELIVYISSHEKDVIYKHVGILMDGLIDELEGRTQKGSFLKLFYQVNHQGMRHIGVQTEWKKMFQWLHQQLYTLGVTVMPFRVHKMFYEAAFVLNDVILRKERKENYDFMAMYYYSSELIKDLMIVSSKKQLFRTVIPYLETYEFSDFFVCLFDEPIQSEENYEFLYPENITMALGISEKEILSPCRFKTSDFLPSCIQGTSRQKNLVVYPMFFNTQHYGYIVCDINIAEKSILRTIREQIVNTLERLRVDQEIETFNAQLREYNKQLEKMSVNDSLTNVLNRRGIFEYIDKVRVRAKASNNKVGIVFGDIDRLKFINDKYGHAEGDYAIQRMADILKEVLEGAGTIGRIGGDEFICVIEHEIGEAFKEEVHHQVEKLLLAHNNQGHKDYDLSISLGYSVWDPAKDIPIEQVIKESDDELYKMKKARKND